MKERRKRVPKDERRRKILELSKKVFAKYGFRKTIMEDIAHEIGFTAAAIYYYFDSKEELFREAISDEIGKVISKIEEEIKNFHSPQEKLIKMIEIKVEGTRELIKMFGISDEIVGELKSEIDRLGLKELASREYKVIEDIIKEGIEKGVFREVDIRKAAFLINVITKELASRQYKKKDIEDIVDIILKGLEKSS